MKLRYTSCGTAQTRCVSELILLRLKNNVDNNCGAVENATAIAENTAAMLAELINILAEKNVLNSKDINLLRLGYESDDKNLKLIEEGS